MIKIYVKTGCPFCAMVLAKVGELGIEIEEKNISDEKNLEELIALGGEKQVPFIFNEEDSAKMYESSDIVEYLTKKYGDGKVGDGNASEQPPGVCPIS